MILAPLRAASVWLFDVIESTERTKKTRRQTALHIISWANSCKCQRRG